MKKRRLGRTGLQVSEIGFGALEIGRPWGLPIPGDHAVPSDQDVHGLLSKALALGINLIDTAPAYMLSEERIGKFLKHRRKEFYLASKCGEYFDGNESRYDFTKAGTLRFIDTSLRNLQTDYLDVVQIHCGPDEVETIRRGEVLEGMLRAREQGKVRWVGVSCQEAGARAALETNSFDVMQLAYSLLNRSVEGEILARAAQLDVGIIVREPLERGLLTDKIHEVPFQGGSQEAQVKEVLKKLEARGIKTPLSQLAIQFVLSRPYVATALVGTRNPHHLEEAVAATREAFDPKLLSEIGILAA
jgi:aryl-alcohol dehydrogenase-like predicted oxidoreductase